jgi:hypothetical protein
MKRVRQTVRLGCAAALVVLVCGGCASTQSRQLKEYRRDPYPFPSTKMNFGHPRPLLEVKSGAHWGTHLNSMVESCVFSCLALPFDLPISLATDSLLLPMDLHRRAQAARTVEYISLALYSTSTPSPEEFMRRYDQAVCEYHASSSVRTFVRQPAHAIPREKLLMLARTEAFTLELAGGSHMDEELAESILSQSLRPPGLHDMALRALADNAATPPAVIERLVAAIALEPRAHFIRARIAKNPKTPVPVLRGFAEDPDLWPYLVSNPALPGDVLAAMLPGASVDALRIIAGHVHATVGMLERIMAEHPSADADLLLRVIEEADRRVHAGDAHFVGPKRKAEDRLGQRPEVSAEQLAAAAARAYAPGFLRTVAGHAAASRATLEAVILRCDELLALLPAAGEHWRVRHAALKEGDLREIQNEARRRLEAEAGEQET